jgi:hypothetical protein
MFEKVRIRFVIIANTRSVQLMEEWLMILWVQLILYTTYFNNTPKTILVPFTVHMYMLKQLAVWSNLAHSL